MWSKSHIAADKHPPLTLNPAIPSLLPLSEAVLDVLSQGCLWLSRLPLPPELTQSISLSWFWLWGRIRSRPVHQRMRWMRVHLRRLPFCWMAARSSIHCAFYQASQAQERGLPGKLWKVAKWWREWIWGKQKYFERINGDVFYCNTTLNLNSQLTFWPELKHKIKKTTTLLSCP